MGAQQSSSGFGSAPTAATPSSGNSSPAFTGFGGMNGQSMSTQQQQPQQQPQQYQPQQWQSPYAARSTQQWTPYGNPQQQQPTAPPNPMLIPGDPGYSGAPSPQQPQQQPQQQGIGQFYMDQFNGGNHQNWGNSYHPQGGYNGFRAMGNENSANFAWQPPAVPDGTNPILAQRASDLQASLQKQQADAKTASDANAVQQAIADSYHPPWDGG